MKLYRHRWFAGLLLAVCLALVLAGVALAQGELSLTLRKVVGSKLGSQINGQMQLSANAPEGTRSVTFELDGAPLATLSKPPFTIGFNTGGYALGKHTFSATAQTAAGDTIRSAPMEVEFISGATVWRTIAPIILVLLLVMILATVVPQLGGSAKRRFEPGQAHDYGLSGGAICPKCRRPFARSVLGPNLLAGKLERCPYCGKWSILRRASREELAKAEAAEAAGARPSVSAPSAEDKLRRQIDDSRYQDK